MDRDALEGSGGVFEEGKEPGCEGGVRSIEVHRSVKVCGDVEGRGDWVPGSGIGIGDENLEEAQKRREHGSATREGGGRKKRG